ncbi:carbamoyltransferase [Oceanobacillus picturae]|uniref:carbamoyltransferase family protein n=1 Tax=Oceanobacillus picturae TaxID=171693 RepID=UPI000E6A7C3A|nr:carbamoyltransferase C-terminal domain-containing protein [Oceanobacillus picturae]RIU88533.1 carbamoyl transferase [Oceanobacillus picturae]
MYILGINSVYHESSVTLIKDGYIIAAAEEERFTRVKHAKPANIDNPDQLPLEALQYCLNKAGIRLKDVDWIGFTIEPNKRLKNMNFNDYVIDGDFGSESGEKLYYNHLLTVPDKLYEMGYEGEFMWIEHHICHASSTYFPSPYSKAAVIAVDGIGETGSTMFCFGEGNNLSTFSEIQYPASLGFLWEKLSVFLGYSEYDASKVMGLAGYGNSSRYIDQFKSIVKTKARGQFEIDNEVLRFRIEDLTKLEQLFQVKKRIPEGEMTQEYKDIAAALQLITEEVLLHMANFAYEQCETENLCLAGGVALNCVANEILLKKSPFNNIYIQPAANDAGTSLGAALYIWHQRLDNKEREQMKHAYLGPGFSNEEIEQAIIESGLAYEKVEKIEQKVARLISEQYVIGWFQGQMEFGPRALGNRSLLADPRGYEMRERINHLVKKREDYRPFAPSVLAEEAENWFVLDKTSPATDFMLMSFKAKDQHKIPAVVHVDGTSRIQTVRKETNKKYYNLIKQFYEITRVPMVLNTSFNDNEPIVCSPHDAINTFKKGEIDYLAIGDFLISKS